MSYLKDFKKERNVYLYSMIDQTSVKDVEKDIMQIIHDDEKVVDENIETLDVYGHEYADLYRSSIKYPNIHLNISCPGGSIYYGLGLYDFIKSINDGGKYKIDCTISGYSASMATIVMLACPERFGTKNSSYLIHSLWSMTAGKLQDMIDDVNECKRLENVLHQIYVENTSLKMEDLDTIVKERKDWWFDSEKALEIGLITKII